MTPEQAVDSDLIVIWGNNVTVSNLHFAKVVKSAREKGAKVRNHRPEANPNRGAKPPVFAGPAPVTDVILAMAVAAELERRNKIDIAFVEKWTVGFDQFMQQARQYSIADVAAHCGLSVDDFHQFVELYTKAHTVAVSIGNGIERGHSGGSGLRAAMALQALTGNHGRVGAGVIAKPGWVVPKTPDRLQCPDLIPEGTRTLNIVDVAEHLLDDRLDPPIRAILIYNHNPVATHPDQVKMIQALEREDLFIAGCDIVMTDSMKYADVCIACRQSF